MAQVNDSGLGLKEFLTSSAPEGDKPSQETAPAVPVVEEKVSTVEDKPAVEAKKEVEAAPIKTETAPKEKEEEPKIESKPLNWDADDNPYKKRYWQTQQYSTTVQQQNSELKRQLEIINKKLDGTYDPVADTPPPVQMEDVSAAAEVRGKALASKESVVDWARANGKDESWVDQQIEAFDRTLGQDPINQIRVLQSRSPVMEAFKIMQEHQTKQKWGGNLIEMEKRIRADEQTKQEAKIEELVNKRLEERLKNIGKQPTGLREARESSTETSNGSWKPKSLDEILTR